MTTLREQIATTALTVTKFRDLMKQMRDNRPADDLEIVKKAYDFSQTHHAGQTRASGDELTPERYIELSKQSVVPEPFTFKSVADGLFGKILDQTLPPGPGPIAETNPGALKRMGK